MRAIAVAFASILLAAGAARAQSPEWQQLTDEAIAQHRSGHAELALAPAKQALDLAIREKGEGHPLVAMSLNNLAVQYRTLGKFAEAEPLYQRAVAIREKAPGPKQADLAASLDNLAMLYDAQTDFDRAEPLYRRALELREKANGAESLEVAASLNNLGEMLAAKRQYEKAEPLLKRAYAIRSAQLPRDDPRVKRTMDNLASTYTALGQFALADEYTDGPSKDVEGTRRRLSIPMSSAGRTQPQPGTR